MKYTAFFIFMTLAILSIKNMYASGPLDPMPNVSRVEPPPAEEGQPTYETDIQCHGGLGTIGIQITGGTGFTYQWKNSSGTVVATTKDLSNAPAGAYTITLFKSGNNSTWNFSLTEPSQIHVDLETSSFQGGYNVSSYGGHDGQLIVHVYGGVPSYYYDWSTGASNVETISNLSATNYSVTVTDENGCTVTQSATLTSPFSAMTITSVLSNHHGKEISCFGGNDGSIDLTVSGGIAPYHYNWGSGVYTQDRTGLTAGNYSVIVDDDIPGRADTIQFTLNQPSALNLSLNAPLFSSGYSTSCYNCKDGKINSTLAGGVTPYSYLWSNGKTSPNLDSLLKGKDTLTVTDNNGCIIKQSIEITSDVEAWKMGGNLNIDPALQFIGTKDYKDVVFKSNDTTRMILKSGGTIEMKSQLKLYQPCQPTSGSDYRSVYADENGILKIAGCGENWPGVIDGDPCLKPYLNPLLYNSCNGSNDAYFNSRITILRLGSKFVIGNPTSLPGTYKLYVTGGILTEKLRVADPTTNYWADYVFDKKYKLMSLSELSTFISKNKHLPGIPTSEEVMKEGIDIAEIQGKLLQKIEELTLHIIEQDKRIKFLESKKR